MREILFPPTLDDMMRESLALKSVHDGRSFGVDLIGHEAGPVLIFLHGFCGFKDWGAHHLVAEKFGRDGLFFVRFNMSHNGTTVEKPTEFDDLEAFARDNYSIQMDDTGAVIDYVVERFAPERLVLVGHSLGGGIALCKAAEDRRVTDVVTWASVSDLGRVWDEEFLARWKEQGRIYYPNRRTGQELPMDWQKAEDFLANQARFDLERLVPELKIPLLFIHAQDDASVPVAHTQQLHRWAPESQMVIVEEGGHTFGARHPWERDELPESLEKVVEQTKQFIEEKSP